MSSRPSRPEPTDRATQRDEDAQYYRQVLHELVEMATDIARAVHRQATAAPSTAPEPAPAQAPQPDPTIAFDRIARTLRRTIALARKLSEPARPAPVERSTEPSHQRRAAARKQIIRAVEDTIQRETDGAEAKALHAELRERLDDPDLEDDLDQLPIAEIIRDICRDLGIVNLPGTHPWKRRTPQDVRDLCARAAEPSVAQPQAAQPRPAQPRMAQPGTAPPPRTPTSTLIRGVPGRGRESPRGGQSPTAPPPPHAAARAPSRSPPRESAPTGNARRGPC